MTQWKSTVRSHKVWSGLKMEPAKGFEPLACGLRNRCSAAELRRHYQHPIGCWPLYDSAEPAALSRL